MEVVFGEHGEYRLDFYWPEADHRHAVTVAPTVQLASPEETAALKEDGSL